MFGGKKKGKSFLCHPLSIMDSLIGILNENESNFRSQQIALLSKAEEFL